MKNAEATTTTETAAVAEQGAQVAPEKAASKKAASPKNGAPKSPKKAKGSKPKAASPQKTAPAKKAAKLKADGIRPGSKTAKVLDLLRRPDGATLKELRKTTGWQAHYADVRIMPTCVGNPVCGAGIAAMESA